MKIEGFGLLSVTAENLLDQWWLWLIAAIVLAFAIPIILVFVLNALGIGGGSITFGWN